MSIEAMKLALEALDLSHPRFGIGTAKHISATAALRQAIAETEKQEPVALRKGECWPEEVMRQWDYWRKEIANGHKGSAPRDWFEGLSELKLIDTTPQQRTWVGLTADEIWTVLQFRGYNTDNIEIAKALEAKLKEKNA